MRICPGDGLAGFFTLAARGLFMKIKSLFFIAGCFFFKNTFISPSSKMTFYGNIDIGKNCRIYEGCAIRVPKTSRLVIKDNCNIMEFSQVMCRVNTITEIGENCFIGAFCFIADQVKFGKDIVIGPGCAIIAAKHGFSSKDTPINRQGSDTLPIEIGSNVWIGAHAIILGPSKIGSDSIIGAGTIVKGDIPAKSIVKGERKLTIAKRH